MGCFANQDGGAFGQPPGKGEMGKAQMALRGLVRGL